MKIIDYKDIPKNSVIILGNFDGLHIGHRAVINHLARGPRVIMTFNPHPRDFFMDKTFRGLYPQEYNYRLMKELSIDYLVEIRFDNAISRLSPDEFINSYISPYASDLVIGSGFRFGYQRSGDISSLNRHGFHCHPVNHIQYKGTTVSSSYIKKMLSCGAIGIASQMLGKKYRLFSSKYHMPLDGIYVAELYYNGNAIAVMTTISDGNIHNISLENEEAINLFDYIVPINILHPDRNLSNKCEIEHQYEIDIKQARFTYNHI